jgi:predicted DNA-binding antitoxin AbrB/MazE fold protein
MEKQVDAIYRNGVLKPLEDLPLKEDERVRVSISRVDADDWMDAEFMEGCVDKGDGIPSLSDVRSALSSIKGAMSDVVIEERGKY